MTGFQPACPWRTSEILCRFFRGGKVYIDPEDARVGGIRQPLGENQGNCSCPRSGIEDGTAAGRERCGGSEEYAVRVHLHG